MASNYKVQHIGSFIRPQALGDAVKPLRATLERNNEGTSEQEQHLREVTEDCIRDVVREQIERGIRPITSGEFERPVYISGLFENLSGFERQALSFEPGVWRPHNPFTQYVEATGPGTREAWVAVDKITRGARSPYLEEWRFLKTCLPEDQRKHAKITIITPTWWHQSLEKPYTENSGYENDEAYLSDIVSALREEILDMYNEGLRNVQIDDPILCWFHTDAVAKKLKEEGSDLDHLMSLCMKAHNQLTSGLPVDLNIGHHMCRGNVPGDPDTITVSGAYTEDLAAQLFGQTSYTQFLMEHVSAERHGGFEFLKHLQPNQVIVLGVATTKFEELEDVQILLDRVLEAANVIAKGQGRSAEDVLRQNIAFSPQCGFASSVDLAGMTIERQWEKMKRLQELAVTIWPQWKPEQ